MLLLQAQQISQHESVGDERRKSFHMQSEIPFNLFLEEEQFSHVKVGKIRSELICYSHSGRGTESQRLSVSCLY